MAVTIVEKFAWKPCDRDTVRAGPQDLKEIERQKELLKDVFNLPQYASDPRKVSILIGVATVVTEICERGGGITDFTKFQDRVINLPDYDFLSKPYPGLNVTGWSIFYALIDPLTYGRKIHRVFEQRGTSGKR